MKIQFQNSIQDCDKVESNSSIFLNYRQTLIGITSYGHNCEEDPAVNAKITAELKEWILNIAPDTQESDGCNL